MFSKIVALCAFAAVAQAGLLVEPHYSSAAAVSSQSIVRHDQPQLAHKLVAAPVAYHAAPSHVEYHAAPAHVAYHAAPAPVTYHAAPAPVTYHAAPAPVAYHAAPPHYSSAAAVSSQSIVRHDQPQLAHKLVAAPVAYHAAPAHVEYHAAPAHVAYHAAPAPVTYHAAPAAVAYHAAPAPVAYHTAPAAVHYSAPIAHEEIAHPQYEYSYSVADGHSGDNKSQQETRDGDVVKGSYSLKEADGSIRTVEYTADDHNGFNAVVHNTAPTHAPVVVKAAPVVYSAPTYYHHHGVSHLSFTFVIHTNMFSKIVALCAFAAVAQAGLLVEPHYSSAAAVSSQSIVRHDQPQLAHKLEAAPVAYHAAPANVEYHAAPTHVEYHAAPAHVAYHAAPAPVTYHAAPAPVAYHAAPADVHYTAPIAHEEIAHPKYEYTYSVADDHTGDNKSQQETRDGDVVKGSYSFHEADGSIRTVEYTADDHNGFNAVVHNTAPTHAPVVVKAAPVVYSAPTYYHH
ncbi:histidine-rich protein PFHRP-II-like [Cydia splendana]|uniref:histidine-rich protein PFHRP-II-like n=1 Tax=Cydia splendana TaxID=1100963 RepID=UPI00300D5CF2